MRSSFEGESMRSKEGEGAQQNIEISFEDVGSVPHIAIEFFALFSRLEFALLASGYSGGDVGANAWVTWDSVAKDIHKSFFAEASVDQEVAILFRQPARTLAKGSAGDCQFVEGQVPRTPAELLLQVRTIRNNLFHGSKVNFTQRDRRLVMAGIRVIRLLLASLDKCANTRRIRSAWGYANVGSQ